MDVIWSLPKGQHMIPKKKGELVYLVYPSWENQEGFLHGFSTRLGGVSRGIYSSVNLSFTRGDEEAAVRENFRRIAEALGFQEENLVCSDQTHTTNVRRVGKQERGCGITKPKSFRDVDGLITNEPGVVLATFYADCVPLFFIDPVKKAVGLSHSGWKGTAGKIGKVTVEAMQREFGSKPEDLLAAVGPSICQKCYEVSEDVIEQFRENFPLKQQKHLYYKKENGKYQLDLWKANEFVFLEAGIKPEKIQMPGICTCCNPDFLFSHRASQGKRGNLGAFLGIRE